MINFRKKFPIITGILCIVVFLTVQSSVMILTRKITHPPYLSMLISEIVCLLVGIALTFAFGMSDIFRQSREDFFRGLVTGGFFIFVSVSSLVLAISISDSKSPLTSLEIAVFVLAMTAVGFTEEIFFRGLLSQMIFEKYGEDSCGVWFSVIVSGLIFGAVHFVNALSADIGGVVIQAICATVVGMCLTALYYRTGNIYVVSALHAFMNFCALFTSGVLGDGSIASTISSYSPIHLLSAIPYIAVTLVLLRKLKMATLLHKPSDNIITVIGKLSSSEKSKSRLKWLLVCIALTAIAAYSIAVIKAAIKI